MVLKTVLHGTHRYFALLLLHTRAALLFSFIHFERQQKALI